MESLEAEIKESRHEKHDSEKNREDSDKPKGVLELPGETSGSAQENDTGSGLLDTLDTLYFLDPVDQPLDIGDKPSTSVMTKKTSGTNVMTETSQGRESRASSVSMQSAYSKQSATSLAPTHSLIIAGPDGSLRAVNKSRTTTRSECGNMHMMTKPPHEAERKSSGDSAPITALPVAVQFERARTRLRNIDENVIRSCQASQSTAKNMERVLDELRQIKSSVRDLNATMNVIRMALERQVEISEVQLRLRYEVQEDNQRRLDQFFHGDEYGGVEYGEEGDGDNESVHEDNNNEEPQNAEGNKIVV